MGCVEASINFNHPPIMPINGPASYLPTTDEFLAHWASANTTLGAAGPIEVTGGVNRAALLALRTQLETTRAQVEGLRNGREEARFLINEGKTALLERLNQFNLKVRSLSPDSKWEAMLPKAYTASEGIGRVLPPLDEMGDLWTRYEAEESPLLLMGAYSLATFTTALTALKAAFTAVTLADNALGLKRQERTTLENRIYPILKAYRQRIPAEFAEGSPIAATLPRLTPVSGSTPDPVVANGNFNATTTTADLNWTASTETDLASYEVRGVAGPDYDTEDEVPLATLPPGAPRTYSTNFALSTPGNAASYKVYVILTTGNERGSNPVTVTRPG